MTPLKKGDPCRVRLPTGEVVDAVYLHRELDKDHWVFVNGEYRLACKKFIPGGVRFVGPACDHVDIVPVGVSV